MRHNVDAKKNQENLGCFFAGLAGISLWVWIILACVKVKICVCGLAGAIISAIIIRLFRKKSINFKTIVASLFGIIFSTVMAVDFGVGIIAAILLSMGMNMGVISIYNVIYEARK